MSSLPAAARSLPLQTDSDGPHRRTALIAGNNERSAMVDDIAVGYPRLVAWIVLVVVVSLWVGYHLSSGDLGVFAALSAAVAAAVGSIEILLGKAAKESVLGRLHAAAQRLFSMPVLITLYVLVIILSFTVSSVTVSSS